MFMRLEHLEHLEHRKQDLSEQFCDSREAHDAALRRHQESECQRSAARRLERSAISSHP